MATGDLKRSLRNLEQVLRALNYPKEVDYVGLIKGDPAASLPIISYSLTSYSPYLTELLVESDVDLVGKNDICFTDTVYKLLRDQFDYKPILTKKQFIQCGFAEWKIQITCDILNCVMKKHKELSGLDKTPSCQRKTMVCDKAEPSSSNEKVAEAVGIDVTSRFITSGKKKAVVIRHLYNEDNVDLPDDAGSSVTDVSEELDSDCIKTTEIVIPEIQVCEVKTQQQDIKSIPEIAALETMLTQCHEKLQKLPCIEQRLDMLERAIKGKVMVDEKTWTNLLSRVTLLETEILLSKKNEFVDSNASEEYTSSSDAEVLPFDRKSNVEGTANVPHSSGYSSVSSTSRASAIRYCGLKDLSEETTIQKMERMKKMFEETAELLKISSR
ncbi:centrosomal protein of 44 kDa isoform X1 [Dipodomys spectabilis]|uniref:centrosomal protein of 44 kDa isoform X1 n=1 Tax=Dipodomys spectabilis TaxID=105255 RepID=UPI001C546EFF|nr:centrosomal protein of 44 kDa isoform X1 [Dipodomys spectabilis]XP_042555966.1 centrosomal protein of 44 kDa isoform X1 [Dipodomys spectabilis]XP_042555968.1 centrosomal protein of 44 kDa isoform X1 [Dipodomys spectabilis]